MTSHTRGVVSEQFCKKRAWSYARSFVVRPRCEFPSFYKTDPRNYYGAEYSKSKEEEGDETDWFHRVFFRIDKADMLQKRRQTNDSPRDKAETDNGHKDTPWLPAFHGICRVADSGMHLCEAHSREYETISVDNAILCVLKIVRELVSRLIPLNVIRTRHDQHVDAAILALLDWASELRSFSTQLADRRLDVAASNTSLRNVCIALASSE
jgi:hypothetical protein